MKIKEMTIIQFFEHLKQNPEIHDIPERYVARLRTLVYYYFVGYHKFPDTKTRESFSTTVSQAILLREIDYNKFQVIPNSGKGIRDMLEKTVKKLLP